VVLNERHLKRILTSYFNCYHHWRTHLSLGMDSPESRSVQSPALGKVVQFTEVGGLHHHYATVGGMIVWDMSFRVAQPIAIYAAEVLGVSPYPFAIAVLIAASAAFSTPVVTLVVEPGRYGFMSFVKVGVPLLLLTYVATAIVAPLLFPFYE